MMSPNALFLRGGLNVYIFSSLRLGRFALLSRAFALLSDIAGMPNQSCVDTYMDDAFSELRR